MISPIAAWRRWRCSRDKHEDILYSVGHHPGKECRYCHRLGVLTPAELEEIREGVPVYIRTPGDDDVVEETEA